MARDPVTDAERAREHILDEAVRARKIKASDKPHYRRLYARDEKGTRNLLTAEVKRGGLMPGLVAGGGPDAAGDDAYPPEWLGPQDVRAGGPVVMGDAGPIGAPTVSADSANHYPTHWLGPAPQPAGPVTFEE